jgi:shikimate dehydrogenase
MLLGHPVGHSMSPVIHQAAYQELHLTHRYELCDVADVAALARAVDSLRRGEIAGANVTVPWKREAFQLADERAPSALGVGAANVLVRAPDGRVVAHNTDVPALAEEIQRYAGAPKRVVVIGSGGAALGAVRASALLNVEAVAVTARRWLHDQPEASWPHAEEFRALGAELVPWPNAAADGDGPFAGACRKANVIVQATSAGMNGADPGASVAAIVPWSRLPASVLAYDLVYNPPDTDFLRAARAYGLLRAHGLGMLVGQAALAIELWLSVKPPREPLYAAAESALLARRGG